jgi:hypothetical protein
MRCEQVQEHISAYLDGELTGDLSAAVRDHLQACPACRALRDDLRATAALLGRLPVLAAPAGLADDVQREIERRRLLAPDDQPAALPPERTLPLHRPRPVARALALAASVLLAAGIVYVAYVNVHETAPTATPEETVSLARFDDDAARRLHESPAPAPEAHLWADSSPAVLRKESMGADSPADMPDAGSALRLGSAAPARAARRAGEPESLGKTDLFEKAEPLDKAGKAALDDFSYAATAPAKGVGGGSGGAAEDYDRSALATDYGLVAVQAIMNTVATGDQPLETLERVATPDNLRRAPSQLVVSAPTREAGNREVQRLFFANGWQPVEQAREDNFRNQAQMQVQLQMEAGEKVRQTWEAPPDTAMAKAPAAAAPAPDLTVAKPESAVANAPDAAPATPATPAAAPDGVFYLASQNGEDTYVVVADERTVATFNRQLASAGDLTVGMDSSPEFQQVGMDQRAMRRRTVSAKSAAGRESLARGADKKFGGPMPEREKDLAQRDLAGTVQSAAEEEKRKASDEAALAGLPVQVVRGDMPEGTQSQEKLLEAAPAAPSARPSAPAAEAPRPAMPPVAPPPAPPAAPATPAPLAPLAPQMPAMTFAKGPEGKMAEEQAQRPAEPAAGLSAAETSTQMGEHAASQRVAQAAQQAVTAGGRMSNGQTRGQAGEQPGGQAVAQPGGQAAQQTVTRDRNKALDDLYFGGTAPARDVVQQERDGAQQERDGAQQERGRVRDLAHGQRLQLSGEPAPEDLRQQSVVNWAMENAKRQNALPANQVLLIVRVRQSAAQAGDAAKE